MGNDTLYEGFIAKLKESGNAPFSSEAGTSATEVAVIRRIRKKRSMAGILGPVAAAAAVTAVAAIIPEFAVYDVPGNECRSAGYIVRRPEPDSREPKIYFAYKNSKALKDKIMHEKKVRNTNG